MAGSCAGGFQGNHHIEQLRGKVIGGYTANATVNVLLTEMLRKKGLRATSIKILNIGTARFGALISGPCRRHRSMVSRPSKRCAWVTRALARAADEVELAPAGSALLSAAFKATGGIALGGAGDFGEHPVAASQTRTGVTGVDEAILLNGG